MEISEIRVKLVDEHREKLLAFCTITFDKMFVVRDLKIIKKQSGPFVAMPSRKLTDRCNGCGQKNHLRARFCNECGGQLDPERAPKDDRGRAKLHTDIAHPINREAREKIERAIVDEYNRELDRSKQPGYRPRDLGEVFDEERRSPSPPPRRRPHKRREDEQEMEQG